jgi:predicted O-methyltransferase YrrM
MNLVLEYIQYLWKSNLITTDNSETTLKLKNCLTSSTTTFDYEKELEVLRKLAKNKKRKIVVQDFGAGSKKMSNQRSIKNIYKTSQSSRKFQRILHKLVEEFNCQSILEMGTSLGFSSVYLSKATKKGIVTTVEACTATANEANSLIQKMNLKNVNLVNSTFHEYFKKYPSENYDFVFVDGHHDGLALLDYMEILHSRTLPGTIFVLDDIRWSDSMLFAWKKLIQKPEFICSYDMFRMGVLVRK